MTIDQILNYEGDIPIEVSIENKNINERLLLIEQLVEEDKNAIYRIIDGILTKSKFKDFFNKNVLQRNERDARTSGRGGFIKLDYYK